MVDNFASDRSHMIKKKIGDKIFYQATPPPYECIKNKDNQAHNLMSFLDLEIKDTKFGENFKNDAEFYNFFKKNL
jgi:hypothetical protein